MMSEFPIAALDRPTKLVTMAFLVAIVGFMLVVPAREVGPVGVMLGWVVPAAATLLLYGWSPKAYRLSADGVLTVRRRLFGGTNFRVQTAEPTSALFGLGGLRLTGSGGVFGWYGLFWRRGTGRYRAYVTDRSRLVSCTGPDGIVVISPADPAPFLAAVPAP